MSLTPSPRALAPACLMVAALWLTPVWSAPAALPNSGTLALARFVHRILADNPDIQAAEAAVDAVRARVTGAGLPIYNPDVELETEQTDTSRFSIGFSQTLDWHDKREVRELAARAELTAASARLETLRQTKASELLQSLAAIQTRLAVSDLSQQRAGILERFAALAKRRYRAGDIPLVDLELARLAAVEATLQQAADGTDLIRARGDFFALSGYDLGGQAPLPAVPPRALPTIPDLEQVARQHPAVQAALARARAQRRNTDAVDRNRRADPTLGVAGGRDDHENLLVLNVSVPLQFRNDFRSRVDAAAAEALQAEREAQQRFRGVLARLRTAQAGFGLTTGAWSVWIEQGHPSLQQRVELLEKLWRAGELNTTDYLQQIQQTLDTRIAGADTNGGLWQAWIEWLSASGRVFDWLGQPRQ